MNDMADSLATVAPRLNGLEDALVHSLEQLGAGVLIKHLGTGRYEYASAAARTLWTGARDPLGATDAELFDAVQAVALRAADQQAVALTNGFAAEHRLERQGERREYLV